MIYIVHVQELVLAHAHVPVPVPVRFDKGHVEGNICDTRLLQERMNLVITRVRY